MTDPRLVSYIQENLAKGVDKDQLTQSLLSVGWNSFVIDDAMDYVLRQSFSQQNFFSQPSQQNSSEVYSQTTWESQQHLQPHAIKQPTQQYTGQNSNSNNLAQPNKQIQQTNKQMQTSKKKTTFFIYIIIIVAVLIVLGALFFFFDVIKNTTIVNLNMNNATKNTQNTQGIEFNATNNQENSSNTNNWQNTSPSIKDCKTNMSCFIEASGLCTPANLTNTVNVDLLGAITTTKTYYEIKGLENTRCLLFLRVENASVILSEGTDFIAAAQAQDDANAQIGKYGLCKYNISDLTATLMNWNAGNYDSGEINCSLSQNETTCTTTGGDFGIAECQGTYFENS